MKYKLLSYPIDSKTPTYGGHSRVKINRVKSIKRGDSVNESKIELPLHAGTHIDFPVHFYENGQLLDSFSTEHWILKNALLIEIDAGDKLLLGERIISKLKSVPNGQYDIILFKIKPQVDRSTEEYWKKNYGIDGKVGSFIRKNIPSVKMVGFNSISLTSYQHRAEGRLAHKEFLNPTHPILVIEDMDLSSVSSAERIKQILVSPLMINNSDGLPVTVWAEIME